MSEHVQVETNGRVQTMTIARADKKNAINQPMYGAMADAIVAYGEDDAIRAMVITGEGDMFTAGNDLADFSAGSDNSGDVPPVVRFLNAIRDCPKPLIAAVNGPAIGVGLTMLLHCDLCYASESATFNAPFVSLGVVPEAASSMLLPASVGMAVANDILLAGRKLNAAEALDFGLISRVFSDATMSEEVRAIAEAVAATAPKAQKISKSLIRTQRDEIAAHMVEELKHFAAQLQSPEFAESVAAKMQKRAPNFD